jgi:hypothetical protein
MRFQKLHKMAESAGIKHNLAENANSVNGLYRLLVRSQRLIAVKIASQGANLSVKIR